MSFLVVFAATFLAATAQTVAGFGFALIAVPLFVTVLDVRAAVGTAALLSFANVAAVAAGQRAEVPWRLVRLLLAGSVCGMPLGLAVLLGVSGDLLRIAVGGLSIVMAGAIAGGVSIRAPGRLGTFSVGVVAGLLSTSVAINGPPVVLYLQALGQPPAVFRGAISSFFVANGLVSLSILAVSGVIGPAVLARALTALPALVAGHWMGRRLWERFAPATFRRLVLGLLVASAAFSLVQGLMRALG